MRHPILWLITLAIVAVVLIGGVAVMVFAGGNSSPHSTNHPDYPYDEQTFEDQGREHIPQGEIFDNYNSNPPTSGTHSAGPAPWAVWSIQVPKEVAVHNMEHGGVVVWYNCDGGSEPLTVDACGNLIAQLTDAVFPSINKGQFILMTEYSSMETRIALTAWRTLDSFDEFDAARIAAFIASFECGAAPEAEQFCK